MMFAVLCPSPHITSTAIISYPLPMPSYDVPCASYHLTSSHLISSNFILYPWHRHKTVVSAGLNPRCIELHVHTCIDYLQNVGLECPQTQKMPEPRPWQVSAGLRGPPGCFWSSLRRWDGHLDRAGGISAGSHIRVVSKMQVKCPPNHAAPGVNCTGAGGYPSRATPGALVAARGFGGAYGEFLDDMCKSPAY